MEGEKEQYIFRPVIDYECAECAHLPGSRQKNW